MVKRCKKSGRREAVASPPEPARGAPRRATADRRLRILERADDGARRRPYRARGLSVQRIRRIVAEVPASREVDPAAGFVQMQIAWINEAKIVARTTMMEGGLEAMGRFIRRRANSTAITTSRGLRRRLGAQPASPVSDKAPVEAEAKIFLPANP